MHSDIPNDIWISLFLVMGNSGPGKSLYFRAKFWAFPSLRLGLNTGMGKPTVFPKWVPMGTGTVVNFGTLQYTTYPYHGFVGIHGLNIY